MSFILDTPENVQVLQETADTYDRVFVIDTHIKRLPPPSSNENTSISVKWVAGSLVAGNFITKASGSAMVSGTQAVNFLRRNSIGALLEAEILNALNNRGDITAAALDDDF